MRIKIIQAASGGPYVNLLTRTSHLHRHLARQMGYDYEVRFGCDPGIHPYWMKSRMLLQSPGYDMVVWMDSDVVWLGKPLVAPVPRIFGMTRHHALPNNLVHYSHFNAGVIYVNFQKPHAVECISRWVMCGSLADDDQVVLNEHFADQITHLGHEWNSSEWIPQYAGENPRLHAWHGCPNRNKDIYRFLDRRGW